MSVRRGAASSAGQEQRWTSDETLAQEILNLRKALADIEQLIAKADVEQREKLEGIKLSLKLALEAAPFAPRASAH